MKSILIVEDSPIESAIYRKLLGDDFHLEFMGSAEDALTVVDGRPFDLLLSDINLPGMSGPEMIAKIREIDSLQDLGIAVVSSDQPGIEQALAAGASAWFLKPINHKIFLESIHVVIDKISHRHNKR